MSTAARLLALPWLVFASPALAQDDTPTAPAPTAATTAEDETATLRNEIQALRGEIEAMREDRVQAEGTERVGFGEGVVVQQNERVDEVVSFGDDVRVAGHVLGDAVSFGGNVVVDRTGRVDGDAVSFGGTVDVSEGGSVGGDRVAMAMPGVGIGISPLESDAHHAAGSLTFATDAATMAKSLYRRLVLLLSVAGAGVLVVGLFPNRVSRVAADLEARPVRAAVVGTLSSGFIAMFAVLFGVLTLGLGLPVSALLVGLLGLAWLLGFVGLCQAVGDRLPFERRPHGRWLAFLVGVVLLTFFGSLPWIGWLVVGAASIIGVGAALSTRFGGATA